MSGFVSWCLTAVDEIMKMRIKYCSKMIKYSVSDVPHVVLLAWALAAGIMAVVEIRN